MGLVYRIEKEIRPYRFVLTNQYTGEQTSVTVAQGKKELFDDTAVFTRFPEACPFFRYDPRQMAHCTVFPTWPEICREFGCWRLLILGPGGKRAGRIMGSRHLSSEDPLLTELWDRSVRTLHEPDDLLWDQKIIAILSHAGFHVHC
ncbi:MAG: YkgJ family cysteine cluster protein [Methanomicrobiales archaeon]|nr:YkgJ family cysteine cluster protein [Methanomicrobiales archaeon]